METGSGRTQIWRWAGRRHISTWITHGMKPWKVRKGGKTISQENAQIEWSREQVLSPQANGERDGERCIPQRGCRWGEGRIQDALRGPTILERIWKRGY